MPPTSTSESELDRVMALNKDQILSLRQQKVKVDDIIDWLKAAGYQIGRTKFYSYLKVWDAPVQRPGLTDDQIERCIIPIAERTLLSDTKIARAATDNLQIEISARQVRRARVQYRIMRRFQDPVEREQHRLATITQVHTLLRQGGGLLHGRRWAISHLRRHFGHHAHQVDVTQAMQEVDPVGVLERRLHRRWRRDELSSGIWSFG
jgi:hypothetical protein